MVSGNRRAGLAEEILSEVFRLYAETRGGSSCFREKSETYRQTLPDSDQLHRYSASP